MDDFTQAVERIVAGLEKRNRLLNPHEREVVAYHEMGHALVAMALPGTDPVQKISIIPRGIARARLHHAAPDRGPLPDGSREELANRMAVLLGGRAAESLIFPEISTGAADDLVRATDIARSMVMRFGMDPELGQVAYEPQQPRMLATPEGMNFEPRRYAESTAAAIDRAVRGPGGAGLRARPRDPARQSRPAAQYGGAVARAGKPDRRRPRGDRDRGAPRGPALAAGGRGVAAGREKGRREAGPFGLALRRYPAPGGARSSGRSARRRHWLPPGSAAARPGRRTRASAAGRGA